VPGDTYDVQGYGACRTCDASGTDVTVCSNTNYYAVAATGAYRTGGGQENPYGYNGGTNGYNDAGAAGDSNTNSCDGCKEICTHDITCQAYDCQQNSNWCELWSYSPSNFMTFSCQGSGNNFRCRVRAPFAASGSNPAHSYSYGTTTSWDTSDANCVETGTPYTQPVSASLSWSGTVDSPVELVESIDLSQLLPTLLPVAAQSTTVTLAGGSTVVTVLFKVGANALTAFRAGVEQVLGSPVLASAALALPVLSVEPLLYSEACAADGSDDTCDDWSHATWSSFAAEYYFYLYDETPDDHHHELKYWQWPRVDPTDGFFHANGFCKPPHFKPEYTTPPYLPHSAACSCRRFSAHTCYLQMKLASGQLLCYEALHPLRRRGRLPEHDGEARGRVPPDLWRPGVRRRERRRVGDGRLRRMRATGLHPVQSGTRLRRLRARALDVGRHVQRPTRRTTATRVARTGDGCPPASRAERHKRDARVS